jgi:ribose 5-phosphate isomerase A
VSFGVGATQQAVRRVTVELGLTGPITVRQVNGGPFITDGGHLILDAAFGRIPDPDALAQALKAIPGVVDHGLFIGLASEGLVGGENGVERLRP